MDPIKTQDLAFLAVEARGNPMHIGFLLRFKLPANAPRDFMQRLQADMARWPVDRAPFNQRIESRGLMGRIKPRWETVDKVDLDYHLRHSALPWPGGEVELGELVSRVHAHPLDLSRPLWVMYLIEGLAHAEFAIYLKIHHTLVDGVALMDIVSRSLAETVRGEWRPVWTEPVREAAPLAASAEDSAAWGRLLESLVKRDKPDADGAAPASRIPRGPACALNGAISRRRRYATQTLPIARIKAIGRAAEATLNDVLLTVCAGALREYLQEFDRLPKESLIATIPVALPRAAGQVAGNSVGSLHVAIASQIADPRQRLLAIRDGVRSAKDDFSKLPVGLSRAVSAVGMLMLAAMPAPRQGEDSEPFTNLTISNLPGPRETLFLRGAELVAMHPVSVLPSDHRLNITVLGYRDQLHFGLIGCPDGLPHLQKIAVALPRVLRELELAMQAQPVALPAPSRRARRGKDR